VLASDLPINLSATAQKILKDVEVLYGHDVWFEEDPDLPGTMMVKLSLPFPTIYIKEISTVTEEGIVHELLHLKLLKLDYPYLMPKKPDSEVVATLINDLFTHAIIFPQLLELGYNPFKDEEPRVEKNLTKLAEESSSLNCKELVGRALLASLYARAQMDCRSQEIIKLCEEIFFREELEVCKETGIRLIEIVRQCATSKINMFRKGLERTVALLELNHSLEIR